MAKEQEFRIEGLEDRILLSATPMETDTAIQRSALQEIQQTQSLFIVDTSVEGYQDLINSLSDSNTEIHFLDPGSGGIEQISSILVQYDDLASVHIVSHGSEASLFLGNSTISNDNIDTYADEFSSWKQALSQNADILFYACEVGHNENGVNFLQKIADLTGADVAASDDTTGVGGDAELEVQTGLIETPVAFSQEDYQSAGVILETEPVIDGLVTEEFTEGDTPILIGEDMSLDGFDQVLIKSATVQITNYVNGEDLLIFNDNNINDDITGSFDVDTGILTLLGDGTAEEYELALQTVTYSNDSENPSTDDRLLRWTTFTSLVGEGGVLIYDADVDAAEDLPGNGQNDANKWESNLDNSSLDWQLNDQGEIVVTLQEVDSSWEGGDIDYAYYFDGSSDAYATMKFLNPKGQIGGDLSEGSVSFEVIARPEVVTGQSVLFETGGEEGGVSITTDGDDVVFKLLDIDGTTSLELKATDVLSVDSFTQIIAVFNESTNSAMLYIDGVLAASASLPEGQSISDWANHNFSALGGVSTQGEAANGSGINYDTNEFSNFTGHIAVFKIYNYALFESGTVSAENTIELTAINNAPEIQSPEYFFLYEDCDEHLSGIMVSDVDSEELTVMLSVNNGSLSLTELTGEGAEENNAVVSIAEDGTITISGEIEDINELLGQLHYTPELDSHDDDSLTIKAQDEDSMVQQTVDIFIEALNDQPDLDGDVSAFITEGTDLTHLRTGILNASDPDGDTLTILDVEEPSIMSSEGLELTEEQINAILSAASFSLSESIVDGEIDWEFTIDDADIEFLAAGEMVLLKYLVSVSDLPEFIQESEEFTNYLNMDEGQCQGEPHVSNITVTIKITGTDETSSPEIVPASVNAFTIPTDFLGTEELFEETLSSPSFEDISLQLQTILHSHSTLSTLTEHVEKELHAMHSDTLEFRDGVLNFLLDDDHEHAHDHGEDENHGSDPAVIQGLYDSLNGVLEGSSLDNTDTQFIENLRDAVQDSLDEFSSDKDASLEELTFELIELDDSVIVDDQQDQVLEQSELDEMRSISSVLTTSFSIFAV